MKSQNRVASLFAVAASALVIAVVSPANSASAQTIDEIVVTASKRGETLIQDIPLSIRALDGAALQEGNALDFADYFKQVPGLSVNDKGPGDKEYIIRGIQSSGAGTVGLYFDEVVVTGEGEGDFGDQPDIKMFDMDRIEVLRGPQGTTFGSSSLSGTIRWIPNTPQYDSFELDVGGGFQTLQESDDLGWQADGVINIPVVEDKLAVRIAGLLLDRAGYIDNRFEEDANDENSEAIRAMLSWRLTNELEFSTFGMIQDMAMGSRNYFNERAADMPLSDTLNGQPLPGTYYQGGLVRGFSREDLNLYNATLELDRVWGTFTATHSVFSRFLDKHRETSVASEILFGLPADEFPAVLRNAKHQRVTSSEIRFASRWDSPVNLLIGAFLLQEERTDFGNYIFSDPITGLHTDSSQVAQADEQYTNTDEIAVFGEVTWDITDRLALTGGGRWFELEMDEQQNTIMQYIFQPGAGLEPLLTFDFRDFIFRGNLAYKANDGLLLYLQVAEGYRGGGANDQSPEDIPGVDVDIPDGFESDSLVNYEFGVKTDFFDNRVTVNASIYRIDWSNIQVEQRTGGGIAGARSFAYRGNGGSAEVNGIELEASVALQDLFFGATVNYMDAKLTEDLPLPINGLKGDKLAYSPDWSGSLNVRYERPIANDMTSFVAADWSYRGESGTEIRVDIPAFRLQESYNLTDLRAGVTGDDWSLILAVDNVFDADDIISYTFDYGGSALRGYDGLARQWPRSFSVMFRKQFF